MLSILFSALIMSAIGLAPERPEKIGEAKTKAAACGAMMGWTWGKCHLMSLFIIFNWVGDGQPKIVNSGF